MGKKAIDREYLKAHCLEKTFVEWSAYFGITVGALRNICAELGIKVKHPAGIHEAYILQNYENKTMVELSKAINWRHSQTKLLCKKLGVTPRAHERKPVIVKEKSEDSPLTPQDRSDYVLHMHKFKTPKWLANKLGITEEAVSAICEKLGVSCLHRPENGLSEWQRRTPEQREVSRKESERIAVALLGYYF